MKDEEKESQPRWAIYMRGADQGSLTSQEERCRRVAAELLGFTTEPVRVYSDMGTDRQGRDTMLQEAAEGVFSDLIAAAPDRISRDALEYLGITRTLTANGVNIHSMPIIYQIASTSSQDVGSRTRRGLDRIAQKGQMPTGAAPHGYFYDRNTKTRKVNEAEAEVVRKVFRMGADGMRPPEIAEALNREGIQTRQGRKWPPGAVIRILRNRPVAGIDHWKGTELRGFTPPIIDRGLFDQVQKLLEETKNPSNSTRPAASGRNSHLLTGFLQCGTCGATMTGGTVRDGRRFYRCTGANHESGDSRACDAPSIGADALEEWVWGYVKETLSSRLPDGTTETLSGDNGTCTAEDEQRITEYWRQVAQKLDGLDNRGRRQVLAELGIRVSAERGGDSIWVWVQMNLKPDENPPPAPQEKETP